MPRNVHEKVAMLADLQAARECAGDIEFPDGLMGDLKREITYSQGPFESLHRFADTLK